MEQLKTVQFVFTEEELKKVKELKGKQNWREFFLGMVDERIKTMPPM